MATRASIHGVGGVLFVVEFVLGVRGRGSEGGEWMRRVPGVLQKRVEGPGRARGVRGVVGVLNQLGGIPPSSLGARGGRRQGGGGGPGPAGPRPGRQVGFSISFVCLIFPFLFLFL